MTDSEWSDVLKIMSSLWPNSQQLNDETARLWRGELDRFPAEWCVTAFRACKASEAGRFFPEIHRIRGMLYNQAEQHSAQQRANTAEDDADALRAQLQAERDRNDREWHEVRKHVESLTDDERERHKASVLAKDWRLEWAAHMPITSRVWVSAVYGRMCRDVGPDQHETPKKMPPKGDQGGDLVEMAATTPGVGDA